MPTFSNIDGEESATVTFTVGAVQMTRNSSAELQEILVLGDPEVASSLGLARVTASAPASTNAALNVRIASGPSSIADLIVRPVAPSTYGDGGLFRVAQSTAGDLNVTVAGYSTTVNVSSLAGPVIVRSSAANLLASVYQSTAADLNVTVAGYSTTVNISSVTGPVNVRSSAANLLASVYQSSFADLNVRINAPSTVNSSNYLPVRLTNSTAFIDPSAEYVTDSTVPTTPAGPTLLLRTGAPAVASTDTWEVARGSTTGSLFVTLATDSGVSAMDSTEGALKVNVVAGAAGGSTTVQVSSVGGAVVVRSSAANFLASVYQSTAADLNVTVAGYSTTANVSSVAGRVGTMPHSTSWGSCGGFHFDSSGALQITGSFSASTTVQVSSLGGAVITRSSAADQLVTVYQSTATDLNVTVANLSTTVNVSSLAGAVIARSSAANFLASVYQSTIGDLLASVQQNTTTWFAQAAIRDSSGTGFVGTTTRPTTGAQGLVVRPVLNDLLSTCFSTIGNGSTSSTIVSSVATPGRIKVYAYSITSTNQAVNTLSFASSLANPIWHVALQSFSSGVSGANLAVTPPAWLFGTAASEPLVFKITGTTGSYHLSFSYFIEA